MEELDLDDVSSTGDHKETNRQESCQKSTALIHACQCSDANCRFISCRNMKCVARHVTKCKRKANGGCLPCKQLTNIFCCHAKYCQEAKCPVPSCLNIKNLLRRQQLLQKAQILKRRIADIQILKRRIADIQNRGLPVSVPQLSPGNSNSSSQLSSHPPQPGIGMKPATGPLVAALQAVRQAPHMVAATAVSYGKENPVVSPPTCNPSVMPSQQMQAQLQKPINQMMPGVPDRMLQGIGGLSSWEDSSCSQSGIQGQPHQPPQLQQPEQMGLCQPSQLIEPGGMSNAIGNPGAPIGPSQGLLTLGPTTRTTRLTQGLFQLLQTLKSPTSPQQRQQVLHILKSNPQLMAAVLRQRTAQKQQEQPMIGVGNITAPLPTLDQAQLSLNQWSIAQQQHFLEMREQRQFPPPQAPLYAQHHLLGHPMNFSPHQQDLQSNGAPQLQQQFLMQPQSKQQMASPTQNTPVSPQQSIMGHPQQPVPLLSPQQLMQQVQSPPPMAAQLVQAVQSPQPIASPRTQTNTPEAQSISLPRQQPAPTPHYHAQTHSPHPIFFAAGRGLMGPDQMTTGNNMMLTQLRNPVSTHPSIASQLQSPVNQDLGLSRDDSDMTPLTPQEQLDNFVANF